jgi:hypothetical protein
MFIASGNSMRGGSEFICEASRLGEITMKIQSILALLCAIACLPFAYWSFHGRLSHKHFRTHRQTFATAAEKAEFGFRALSTVIGALYVSGSLYAAALAAYWHFAAAWSVHVLHVCAGLATAAVAVSLAVVVVQIHNLRKK